MQVLTERQSGADFRRITATSSNFTFRKIEFNLDASSASCNELRYLCASFNEGDNPNTQVGTAIIPFRVRGVVSEQDSTPYSSSLIGCQAFTGCNGTYVAMTDEKSLLYRLFSLFGND